jgi:hypothetical protein
MNRDKGLRRATAITGALVAASLAGTAVVAVAAHAADTSTSSSTESPTPTATADSPTLSTGSDDSGQATSGGS